MDGGAWWLQHGVAELDRTGLLLSLFLSYIGIKRKTDCISFIVSFISSPLIRASYPFIFPYSCFQILSKIFSFTAILL